MATSDKPVTATFGMVPADEASPPKTEAEQLNDYAWWAIRYGDPPLSKRARLCMHAVVHIAEMCLDDKDVEFSVAHVAHLMRVSDRVAKRCILELESGGYIKMERASGQLEQHFKMPIPKALRELVLARDDRKCKTCGSTENLCADHIYPEVHGGPTTAENLQTLCRSCNSRKGAKLPE